MDAIDFVWSAFVFVVGALVLYVFLNAVLQIFLEFSATAAALFGAFIAGVILYLRRGPSQGHRNR